MQLQGRRQNRRKVKVYLFYISTFPPSDLLYFSFCLSQTLLKSFLKCLLPYEQRQVTTVKEHGLVLEQTFLGSPKHQPLCFLAVQNLGRLLNFLRLLCSFFKTINNRRPQSRCNILSVTQKMPHKGQCHLPCQRLVNPKCLAVSLILYVHHFS